MTRYMVGSPSLEIFKKAGKATVEDAPGGFFATGRWGGLDGFVGPFQFYSYLHANP